MDWKSEHPEYEFSQLDDASLPTNPWTLWNSWLEMAKTVLTYTNEIALATARENAEPSVRMVLLKHSSEEEGFCWYTNARSEKGQHLLNNPYAEILWFVKEQQRQVRIRGGVTRISREQVVAYAQSRPKKSQISALISEQSREIEHKSALISKYEDALKKYADKDSIPVSEDWTGFSLNPIRFEFWQGNTNRLHDRIVYTLLSDKVWKRARLQP